MLQQKWFEAARWYRTLARGSTEIKLRFLRLLRKTIGTFIFKQTPNKDKWTPGTMHIHDLNATILHQLGIDHRRLTYRYQGRDFRLTDVHGHVIKDIIA